MPIDLLNFLDLTPLVSTSEEKCIGFLDQFDRFLTGRAGMVDRTLFPRAAKVAPEIVAIKRRRYRTLLAAAQTLQRLAERAGHAQTTDKK